MKKKILVLLLVFGIIFTLCSCGEKDKPGNDVPNDTDKPEDIKKYDDSLIGELYSLDGEYTDGVGNTYNYSFHVPAIYEDTDGAEKFNEDIAKDIASIVADEQSNMKSEASLGCHTIKWESHWHDSAASIVITMDTDWGFSDYWVRTYDFKSGKLLNGKELLERAGISESDFLTKAKAAIEKEFDKSAGTAKDDTPDFYQQQRDWTLSSDRINTDMKFYWDKNGDIMLIADIAAFAGADSYYHIIPLK